MKLRTALSQHPVTVLREIAEATDLEVEGRPNKPALIDVLSRHLANPKRVAACLKGLKKSQRDFTLALAAEGGEMLKEVALGEIGEGFSHRFDELLGTLSQVGLVFEDTQTLGKDATLVGIPTTILKSVPPPEHAHGRLRSAMESGSISILRDFARDLGVSASDNRRPFLVEAVRAALLDPDQLKAYLKSLTDEKRGVLDMALERDGVTRESILNDLGEAAAREFDDLLWKTPLFVLPEDRKVTEDQAVYLADDLKEALLGLAESQGGRLEGRPEDALHDTDAPDQVESPGSFVVRDLATLLGLIARRRPRTLKRGGMPRGELREAGRFFKADADPGYPDFLMLLAENAGLVERDAGHWRVAEDGPGRLERAGELLAEALTFWRETDRWNEWAADRTAPSGRRTRADDLNRIRGEILEGLGKCAVGKWVGYTHFYRLLCRTASTFRELAEGPPSGRSSALRGTTADELLRRVFTGALAWLGVIDLGTPRAFDRPLHHDAGGSFRVTPLGAQLLTGKPEDVEPPGMPTREEARFVIQPNLEVLAPPELPYDAYVSLCAVAELRTIDVMTNFEITREALLDALNRGWTGEGIRSFFAERSATGVPDMVSSLIDECDDKHGEIEVRPASGYISVDEPTLLEELLAQKAIAEQLGDRLSPNVAAIQPGSRPDLLVQLLSRHGYMPALDHQDEHSRNGQHRISLLTTDLAMLVAYLEAASEHVSESTGEPQEDIEHLARRLKRNLRRAPAELLGRNKERFDRDFARTMEPPVKIDGSELIRKFKGENPAETVGDLRALTGYAIEHRLCVEIIYGTTEAPPRVVQPTSDDDQMVYAYCRSRRGDRVFRYDKIQQAELVPEGF